MDPYKQPFHSIVVFVDMRGFTRLAQDIEFHPVAAEFVNKFLHIVHGSFKKPLFVRMPPSSYTHLYYEGDGKGGGVPMEKWDAHPMVFKGLGDGAMLVLYTDAGQAIEMLPNILGRISKCESDFSTLLKDTSREIGVSISLDLGWSITRGTVFNIPPFSEPGLVDAIGGCINRAARLCDCARPNGVVIDKDNFPDKPSVLVDGNWFSARRRLIGIGDVDVWESYSPHNEFQMREKRAETPEVHVAGVCYRSTDKKFFIARRKVGREIVPGLWEGCGGQIRKGESFAQGIVRHYRGELSMTVRPIDDHYVTYFIKEKNIPGIRYICEFIEGEPVLINHTEAKWVSLNELLAMPAQEFPAGFQGEVATLAKMASIL